MLVLTRRRGQSVMIGDDVRIVIVEISGDQVRLGIEAPRTVEVHRQEVYDDIVAQNTAASLSSKKRDLES
jgi:carbon storage regulator